MIDWPLNTDFFEYAFELFRTIYNPVGFCDNFKGVKYPTLYLCHTVLFELFILNFDFLVEIIH